MGMVLVISGFACCSFLGAWIMRSPFSLWVIRSSSPCFRSKALIHFFGRVMLKDTVPVFWIFLVSGGTDFFDFFNGLRMVVYPCKIGTISLFLLSLCSQFI